MVDYGRDEGETRMGKEGTKRTERRERYEEFQAEYSNVRLRGKSRERVKETVRPDWVKEISGMEIS